MNNFFLPFYYWIKNNALLSVGLLLALVVGLGFLAIQLELEEDITQLIPANEKTNKTQQVLEQVNFADKIIFYLEQDTAGNVDDLTAYASRFVDSLQLHVPDYIEEIQGQVEDGAIMETLDFVYEHLPLFLNQKDYESIAARLHPDSIQKRTAANYKTLISPSGIVAKKLILKDPLGLSFLGIKKLQELNMGEQFDLYNGFLVSKDQQQLLLFIVPKLAANETAQNAIFVEKLYQISERLNQNFAGKIKGEYYGTTVIAVANAQQIKRDIQITISIAMSILLFILVFFYRTLTIPFILFVPTFLGGLLGIAALYLIRTKTSAISLGIGSVLLGITLDYSLHILTHYRNHPDIKQLYADVTRPILMSSFTTAFAFLCLLFLPSAALQDLGLFAAVSVVGASVFALLFIPQVYRGQDKQQSHSATFIDRIAAYDFDKNKWLMGAFALLLVLSCWTYDKVVFNQDLSAMNFQTVALKETEKKLDALLNNTSKSVYVVAYADTEAEALNYHDAIFQQLKTLKAQDDILSFSSIGSIVLSPQKQEERIQTWNNFWTSNRVSTTKEQLLDSGGQLNFKPSSFDDFYQLLNKKFETIPISDYMQVKGLYVEEYLSNKNNFSTIATMVKVSDERSKDLIAEMSNLPQTVVIDRQHMNETFLGNLKNDFNRLITYSLAAVFILLLVFFRRIELTLITLIPILLTGFLTAGMMGVLGLEFNIFNIIISTFIFGLGVDYSIFITNGLIKQYKYGVTTLPTYRAAIILSVITTILGIGALIFAQHPALKSIALVSLIGILSAVFISFTIQPLLFRFAISGKAKKGLAPMRLRTSVHGFFLFAYYGLGGMLLSLFSVTIFPLVPISKKKKMRALHRFMSLTVTSVLYGNPFVKKVVLNPHQETFDKPAIIISNHASALDTLVMGMVTHKLIYLVNDWVYKSPIFGLLARVAGFYPVSSGVDNSHEHLKEKIRQGYSLVVFPEGKRSKTNKIGRFHKGAFFLAEELQLDILPFYLHGNSEVLPKGDRVIYDGSLTVKIGQRIAPDDERFGSTYKERQKKLTAFYRAEFQQLRNEIETADYFKAILLSNYIYKGDDFYQNIKQDFNTNKHLYQAISTYIPFKSHILHLSDDYGQIDILLVARSLDRRITTLIAHSEKKAIATNCYTSSTRRVSYPSLSTPLENIQNWTDIATPKTSVLLVSATLEQLPSTLLHDLEGVTSVVLVNNMALVEEVITAGFFIKEQEENIIALERMS